MKVRLVDPLEKLARCHLKHGTQAKTAEYLGISQPYLNDLLKGRRPFSKRVLDALNLREIVILKEDK